MRIHLLDVLRGSSVIAMIVYHFFWDLGYFNFIELEYMTNGLPLVIAQCIGASFIIISGISFRLASLSKNFRVKFLKRLRLLVLISLLITLVTFFIDQKSYIFFGVLHFLAICSFVGFFLTKIKNSYIVFVFFTFSTIISISKLSFDLPGYLAWLGFNQEVPITNDFYPLFPWISFFFFGLWVYTPLQTFLLKKNKSSITYLNSYAFIYKGLQFLGRNSLTFYILHQPIFFSLFLIFISISS